jgi:nucleoid-associated protein YgaU
MANEPFNGGQPPVFVGLGTPPAPGGARRFKLLAQGGASMSKEIKIGLAIVGALGLTLGAVLSMRLRASDKPATAVAEDARQALATLKDEKARMDHEPEKPSLFAMNDAATPAGGAAEMSPTSEPPASQSLANEPPASERRDPFMNRYAPASTSDAVAAAAVQSQEAVDSRAANVGDRYATPPPVSAEVRREEQREERREERREEQAAVAAGVPLAVEKQLERKAEAAPADPFQRGNPASANNSLNNPMAGSSGGFGQPQATLADGITPEAPAGDPQQPSPYGPPPIADPSAPGPLTRSTGEVQLDPNPNGANPTHHHHEQREAEMLQTAGEVPVPPAADSRYGDYRTGRGNPTRTEEAARDRAVMNQMRREDDRYGGHREQAAPASTAQFDIYGRDIRNERDDPPPDRVSPTVPDAPATRLTDDPLGRRTDNIAPDGTDAAPLEGGGKYTVVPGDNFWTISQKVYGSGAYFKALEEHNREQFPYSDKLPVGQEVGVPPRRELEEKYPDLCPRPRGPKAPERGAFAVSNREGLPRGGRTYKVQDGDTLFDIARDQLGKAARWNEIYELNRGQLGNDFNFLAPGMELILPENHAPRDPLTTQARQPQTR